MSEDIVRWTVDLDDLPPLTEQEKAELDRLAAMPDELIDTSDIPPLSDEFWERGVRGRFHRPRQPNTDGRDRSGAGGHSPSVSERLPGAAE